jgi:hypothetical protein
LDREMRPKWYEEAMMADVPVMKKDMMTKDDCMDKETNENTGDLFPIPPGMMAHAYVPWQCYDKAFSPCEALMRGTLFPELWGAYPIPE